MPCNVYNASSRITVTVKTTRYSTFVFSIIYADRIKIELNNKTINTYNPGGPKNVFMFILLFSVVPKVQCEQKFHSVSVLCIMLLPKVPLLKHFYKS